MKVVSKEIYYEHYSERYDLNETFSTKASNKGLVICYALASCKNIKFVSLELDSEFEEIGVGQSWHYRYTAESFAAIYTNQNKFLHLNDVDDFAFWHFTFIYQNVEVSVGGHKDTTEISLSYPQDKKINLLPLLSEIETSTYEFNNYDQQVLSILKNEYGMSPKRAVLSVQKLLSHQDIYDEFVLVATSGEYAEKSSAIVVEGYTAENLNTNFPLSVLGAYNYLIYLRESPQKALTDLKNGLPRR